MCTITTEAHSLAHMTIRFELKYLHTQFVSPFIPDNENSSQMTTFCYSVLNDMLSVFVTGNKIYMVGRRGVSLMVAQDA